MTKCFGVNQENKEVDIPTPQVTVNTADELLKFKKLLDMGAISQEEYDKKKAELL